MLFGAMLLVGSAAAQVSMDIVGRAEFGAAYVTYVHGNYLYVGAGDAVLAYDISQSDTMVLTGYSYVDAPGGSPHSFAMINDQYMIAALYDYGYGIINLADPAHPRVENIYSLDDGRALWVYVSGHYAYLADGPRGLLIIDVTDPTNPQIVGNYPAQDGASAAGVYVQDTIAYVAMADSGLRILNVADPQNPVEISGLVLDHEIVTVVVRDTFLYAATGHGGLAIISVADITTPYLVGGYDTDGYVWDVILVGDHIAVVSDWNKGVKTIDVTDPTNPTLISGYDTDGNTWRVQNKDSCIYAADKKGGVVLLAMSDSGALSLVNVYKTGNWVWGVDVEGDLMAVGGAYLNAALYDISDPSSPQKIVEIPEYYRFVWSVELSDTLLFLSANADGVPIYNVADPTNPVLLGVANATRAQATLRDGNILYVAIGTHGVASVDISDPTNPVVLDTYDTGSNAFRLALRDTLLFVADKSDGMVVLNVAHPDSITLVTIFTMTDDDDVYGIDIYDTLAILGNWDAGLFIASIADPANPQLLGSIPGRYRVRDARYMGSGFVVTAEEDSGICVYDISDPTNIQFVTGMALGDWAWEVKPIGGGLYTVAARGSGVYIIRITPVSVEEDGSNGRRGLIMASAIATDQIRVKFYYPVERSAKLELYSADGRLVNERTFTAGPSTSELVIPTTNLTNGVYIMRLKLGDREFTQKIEVVK